MARNGSGTYSFPATTWDPAVGGVTATTADWNTREADLSAALTQSVSKDGQTTMTGNLPMGNNKLTGLAAGSATGNSVRWEQLFSQGPEADLASATTTDIGAQNTNFLRITGTTTITSFGANYNGPRFLRFGGALVLTHNASTLILPGAANITTAAGDTCIAIPLAAGWYVVAYQRAATTPLGTTGTILQELTFTDAGTTTTNNTLTSLTASAKSITPKSSNSTLVVECSFSASVLAAGAAANATGAFRLYNNTGAADIGVGEITCGVSSAGGANLQFNGAATVRATLANSGTTAIAFLLRGRYSASATTVGATFQQWTIREIQN